MHPHASRAQAIGMEEAVATEEAGTAAAVRVEAEKEAVATEEAAETAAAAADDPVKEARENLQGAQMMYNYDWANPNRESVLNNAIDAAAKAGVPKEELDEVRKWKNSWQMDMSNYR